MWTGNKLLTPVFPFSSAWQVLLTSYLYVVLIGVIHSDGGWASSEDKA